MNFIVFVLKPFGDGMIDFHLPTLSTPKKVKRGIGRESFFFIYCNSFFSAQVRLDLECVLLCGDSFIVCLDRKGKARASVNLECNISGHTWGLGKYVHPPDKGLVRLLINTTKSTPHPLPLPPQFFFLESQLRGLITQENFPGAHLAFRFSLFAVSYLIPPIDDCLCSRILRRVRAES